MRPRRGSRRPALWRRVAVEEDRGVEVAGGRGSSRVKEGGVEKGGGNVKEEERKLEEKRQQRG